MAEEFKEEGKAGMPHGVPPRVETAPAQPGKELGVTSPEKGAHEEEKVKSPEKRPATAKVGGKKENKKEVKKEGKKEVKKEVRKDAKK